MYSVSSLQIALLTIELLIAISFPEVSVSVATRAYERSKQRNCIRTSLVPRLRDTDILDLYLAVLFRLLKANSLNEKINTIDLNLS